MTQDSVISPVACSRRPDGVTVWTQRDYDILQSLAIRIRMLSVTQATQIWWPQRESLRDSRRCLRRLTAGGLVHRYVINAHPLLAVTAPLTSWKPGQLEPDCHELSLAARRRWNRPTIPLEVFTASKQTANLFGGVAYGLPRLEQRDHDLLLADAFVAYRCNRPSEAEHWVGEDFLPKAGFRIKDPDAFLINDHGQMTHVIESAGRYTPKQINSFHEHCSALDLPYELW